MLIDIYTATDMAWDRKTPGRDMGLLEAGWAVLRKWARTGYPDKCRAKARIMENKKRKKTTDVRD